MKSAQKFFQLHSPRSTTDPTRGLYSNVVTSNAVFEF